VYTLTAISWDGMGIGSFLYQENFHSFWLISLTNMRNIIQRAEMTIAPQLKLPSITCTTNLVHLYTTTTLVLKMYLKAKVFNFNALIHVQHVYLFLRKYASGYVLIHIDSAEQNIDHVCLLPNSTLQLSTVCLTAVTCTALKSLSTQTKLFTI